jgi:hypothetical protein
MAGATVPRSEIVGYSGNSENTAMSLVKEGSLWKQETAQIQWAQRNSISRENDVSFDERVVLTDDDEIGGWVPALYCWGNILALAVFSASR